jgi:chromosome segregation ATPase
MTCCIREPVTSPLTDNLLPSEKLTSLTALKMAIETYMVARPELKEQHLSSRSFEEACRVLHEDLEMKQALHSSVHTELSKLQHDYAQVCSEKRALEESMQEEIKRRCNAKLHEVKEKAKAQALTKIQEVQEEREKLRQHMQNDIDALTMQLREAKNTNSQSARELSESKLFRQQLQERTEEITSQLTESRSKVADLTDQLERNRLDSSETQEQLLECRVQLAETQIALATCQEKLLSERELRGSLSRQFAHSRSPLHQKSTKQSKSSHDEPRPATFVSMMDFLRMVADTKARLPHRLPPIPPLPTLANAACWKDSECSIARAAGLFLS